MESSINVSQTEFCEGVVVEVNSEEEETIDINRVVSAVVNKLLEDTEDTSCTSSSCSESSVITLEPCHHDHVIELMQDLDFEEPIGVAPTDNDVFSLDQQGSPEISHQSSEEITVPPPERMDSSTEVLHHHHRHHEQQYPAPPTFSTRLPPDGDEFPNNCWSDEKLQQGAGGGVGKKFYRSEFSIDASSNNSSEPNSPPPLPTSEPPKEDYPSISSVVEVPPLPQSVPPPLPPPKNKAMAARRCSFDDRKKLFESSSPKDIISSSVGNNNMNGSHTLPPPSSKPSEEPSKKSVRDKIAMFSSRSSSEDSAGEVSSSPSLLPKQISNHVSSSLSKSTVNISNSNGFSKSSDNLLGGGGITSSGRKGSIDLTLAPATIPSSLYTHTSPAAGISPLYAPVKGPNSLYERSQSMIDVGGGSDQTKKNASYQNSVNQTQNVSTNRPAAMSNMMEQRRKCMTKLRGLVIPDNNGPGDAAIHNNHHHHGLRNLSKTSASVADLPTIISKDAVILPHQSVPSNYYSNNITSNKPTTAAPIIDNNSIEFKKSLSRTESLDRFSSMSYEQVTNKSSSSSNQRFSTLQSAKTCTNNNSSSSSSDLLDSSPAASPSPSMLNSFPNILPKYSPAFKRRGLSSYHQSASLLSTGSSSTLPSKITPPTSTINNNANPYNKQNNNNHNSTNNQTNKSLLDKPIEVKIEKEPLKQQESSLNKGGVMNGKSKGKLEDSDNDSAVSSSRSSISHGLSPPNSPTPGESTAATPDPDLGGSATDEKPDRERGEEEEASMNVDGSWRILKPTSIEAINRKNVLKSAKFSSGVGALTAASSGPPVVGGSGGDDSSLSSSNGKNNNNNRRSDDEDASYADAETEDTESSCSELEGGGSGNRRRMIVNNSSNNRADTTEDDDDEPPQQSAVNMEFTELTESPLQAIFDMEEKMAYINEVCDALNDGRGRSELSSRYFSRRDSEATVIERPIEPKRKSSIDTTTVDGGGGSSSGATTAAERRARNRSSSGNESDFSSNVSVGSQPNSHKPLSRETSSNTGTDTERWSLLEKKYSRSMTSVNSLGINAKSSGESPQTSAFSSPHQQTSANTSSFPKIVTSASEIVEKKIEKIIEKSSSDGVPKKTNATIPRGRNDFKSISEKWQKIEKSTDSPIQSSNTTTTTTTTTKPIIADKPLLSPQSSSGSCSISSTPRSLSSQLTSPPPTTRSSSTSSPSPTKSLSNILSDSSQKSSSAGESPIPKKAPSSSSSSSSNTGTTRDSASMKAKLEAMEADRAWTENKRRSDGEPSTTTTSRVTGSSGSSSTKRSVSVNDIRKAFEKAEIAVNSYGREESSPTEGNGKNNDKDNKDTKDKEGGNLMILPAAHFRVSSFDSTTSEESSAATPAGMYGSSNSLVSSAPRDPYGSITSLASSTSLISPQELQQLIEEANQSLEEAGTPSHEVSVVILHREFAGGSLGITLAGGADYETKEITVHKVLTSSIADRDGRIHRCDRILSINGKSTKGLTHREALNLLKSPRTEVVLVVSRGRPAANGFQTIEETSALDRAIEPLLNGNLVDFDDNCYKWGPLKTATLVKDGAGLGFSLEGGKGSIQGDKPLTVKKIFIGGPAEKSNELRVGDLIVSINGINMSSKSRTEAWNFMKKLSDGDVKIGVRTSL